MKKAIPVNAWWCETCKSEEMKHAEMKAHLKEKHGLKTEGLQCCKKMLVHIDGATWFSSTYEIIISSGTESIVLNNKIVSPRMRDDIMRHA